MSGDAEFEGVWGWGVYTHTYGTKLIGEHKNRVKSSVPGLPPKLKTRNSTTRVSHGTSHERVDSEHTKLKLSAICRQIVFCHQSSLLGFGLITVTHGKSRPPSVQSSVCLLLSSTCIVCHKRPPSSGTRAAHFRASKF